MANIDPFQVGTNAEDLGEQHVIAASHEEVSVLREFGLMQVLNICRKLNV